MSINESKNGILMKIGVSVKDQTIWVLIRRIICRILTLVTASVISHAKLINI